jgi:hypothetical protein
MVAVTEYYRRTPVFLIVGGSDFDFSIQLIEVVSTETDGRITELQRVGPRDFSGWSAFAAQFTSYDGRVRETVSVIIDGQPDEGTLRMRGVGAQTWRMQQAGVRGGRVTIIGSQPGFQRCAVMNGEWRLSLGATAPTTPTVPDPLFLL